MSKTTLKIIDFWQWVQMHEHQLIEFSRKPEEHFDTVSELQARVQKIEAGLVCDVGVGEKGSTKLVISAEGNKGLFPVVMRIVGAAPEFKEIEVRAFRPRHDGHAALVWDGFRLASDELMVRVRTLKAGGIEIETFVQGYDPRDSRYEPLVRLLLMHALGEYDAVTKVKILTLYAWPQKNEGKDLQPWIRLPTIVDELVGSN